MCRFAPAVKQTIFTLNQTIIINNNNNNTYLARLGHEHFAEQLAEKGVPVRRVLRDQRDLVAPATRLPRGDARASEIRARRRALPGQDARAISDRFEVERFGRQIHLLAHARGLYRQLPAHIVLYALEPFRLVPRRRFVQASEEELRFGRRARAELVPHLLDDAADRGLRRAHEGVEPLALAAVTDFAHVREVMRELLDQLIHAQLLLRRLVEWSFQQAARGRFAELFEELDLVTTLIGDE
jgi:hypothetical protein